MFETPKAESILPRGISDAAPTRLTFWKVAFAVLAGNLMTGIIGGLVWIAVTH
jgi:hypothetical protein